MTWGYIVASPVLETVINSAQLLIWRQWSAAGC